MSEPYCDQSRHADLAPRLHLEVHMQMGPTGATEAARLIDAYRAEVLREAAEKIRANVDMKGADLADAADAADFIDPDKT